MADSYDLILKGGTVVNQDGEGVRDSASRRAALPPSATCRWRPPARRSTAAACTSCPA